MFMQNNIEKESMFWVDQVAREVVEREKRLNRGIKVFRTEMGLGASGVPHVGSAGDGVRSYVVNLALKGLGAKSEFIAFSDDLDGLRKVPIGFPQQLEKDIGKPVSFIDDPFGCHKSFSAHVSSLLTDAFEKIGVEYILKKASEEYPKGTFDGEITDILNNWKDVGKIIFSLTGQDKYLHQMPFMPFCEKCGRVNTTIATKFENGKVYYSCTGEFIGKDSKGKQIVIKGCGHIGETGIRGGKLAWKSDFAARWRALKISYEAYGKDILDSVMVNDAISKEILKWEPPVHSFYELFTERAGKKISKSVGNVFTPQLWLRYASPESLRLLFLKKLGKSRVVDIDAIPAYADEVDELANVYFGKKQIKNERELAHMKRLYEYVNFLQKTEEPEISLQYNMLVNLFRIVSEKNVVRKILGEMGRLPEKISKSGEAELGRRLENAMNWVIDSEGEKEIEIRLNYNQKKALAQIAAELKGGKWMEKDLEARLYEIAKENDMQTKELFSAVYQTLLGAPYGPRLAMLILAIGQKEVAKRLEKIK